MTPSKSSMLARCAVVAMMCVAWAPAGRAAVIGLDLTTTNPGPITLASGDNTFTYDSFSIDYLIVAGGGGGGSTASNTGRRGGGGGAGGLLQGAGLSITGPQTITVGVGGSGGVQNGARGINGGDSSAFSLIAIGGGGGASAFNQAAGSGGSGGGAYGASNSQPGGSGTVGQGFAGGGPTNAGSGGGGAGAAAVTGANVGGAGAASSISGSSVTYATGGNAGGGSGGQVSATPAPAAANTGNGGNGITPNARSGGINGQAGGSGIVVVRYSGAQVLAGGSVSTVGGDTVHQFLSTGASTLDLYSATIDGDIDGSGDLRWNKTGILTLGGANTYAGSTQIDSGTIELSGSIGSTSDLTFVSGVLDLGSTGLVRVLQANYSIADANTDISNNLIVGDDTLTVTTFNDGINNYTQILAVPEPAVLALAACGGAIGIGVLWRRRRPVSA